MKGIIDRTKVIALFSLAVAIIVWLGSMLQDAGYKVADTPGAPGFWGVIDVSTNMTTALIIGMVLLALIIFVFANKGAREGVGRLWRGRRGFTLIELLVVVAILGVLMAVVVPNVAQFINQGNAAAADAELASVQTAVDAAMATAKTGELAGVETFGPGDDCVIGGIAISTFLRGGMEKVDYSYTIAVDGTVARAG